MDSYKIQKYKYKLQNIPDNLLKYNIYLNKLNSHIKGGSDRATSEQLIRATQTI